MKKAIGIIASFIGVPLVVILCFLWAADGISNTRDVRWYANYVQENAPLLEGISAGEIDPEQSLYSSWILRRGAVEMIQSDEQKTIFHLKTGNAEGHYVLVYSPEEKYQPRSLDFYDNWQQLETADGSWRWEGGMSGRGYIDLHDLGRGFYLEEAYLPT